MRFNRLTIEAGGATFSLDLHPQMTVIAGVGPLEREGLVNELIGSLGTGRTGVHLELTADDGSRLRVTRPGNEGTRIVDVDSGADVTSRFTSSSGKVSMLAANGIDPHAAKVAMRMTEEDLTSRSQVEQNILALAHVDQARLWDVARKVSDREVALDEVTGTVTSRHDDSSLLAEIETSQSEFEAALDHHERVRSASLLVGANLALLAVPLAIAWGLIYAAPAIVAAIAMTVYSAMSWRKMTQARGEAREALEAAGADTYLSFQINRVNSLLSDDHRRREMMQLAEYHRAALAEWHMLAGDISVAWATEHRSQIQRAARHLRDTVGVSNPMALTMSQLEGTEADLAHTLQIRLNKLRSMGMDGERLPLLLDEPFMNVPPEVKPRIMNRLEKAARDQQVILLTGDPDLADWARVAPATEVRLVEPGTSAHHETNDGKDSPRRRHRRIAVA